MRIELVAPAVWRTAAEQAMHGLPSTASNALVNTLNLAHNRHVGLPVALARDLVALLFNLPVAQSNPWLSVKQRLQAEVQGEARHGAFPILLMAHRAFVISRLALPLIAAASQRLGVSALHREAEDEGDFGDALYEVHSKNMAEALVELSAEQGAQWSSFFQRQATTLAGLARRDAGLTAALLPTPDRFAYDLWQTLDVEATLPRHKAAATRQMNTTAQHREVRKRREGGINGVYLTRRPEDLDHILFSEFLNHRAVLAERLVNGGFLAYRRHPRREKLRHALVTAMVPPGLSLHDPKLAFLKVCWLHAMGRFAWLLHRAQLSASEFRLIEGNAAGQVHVRAAVLADMPDVISANADAMSSDFLRIFATALGWTPHLFETRPRFANLDQDARGDHWLAQVWHAQTEHPAWARQSGKQGTRWDLSQYSYVHVSLLLPQSMRKDEAYHAAALARSLGFARHDHAYVSCLWVPDDWDAPWSYEAGAQVFELSLQDRTREQFASQIVQRWLHQWMGEMSRGA